jgi:transposase InsO family protein
MKAASFEYIEVFYNQTHQHSTLGYQSPIQSRSVKERAKSGKAGGIKLI